MYTFSRHTFCLFVCLRGDMKDTEKNYLSKDTAQLYLHCHRLLSPPVSSSSSSTSSSSHFHLLNMGSCLGSSPEILSPPSSFPPSFLKGIIVHCSIYRPVTVCVCFPVSQLWNSSVKESARSQGGTRLHSHTDIHLNTEGQSHKRLSHRIQNEFSICSEVGDERGWRRDRDSRRGRKLKMKGSESRNKGRKSFLLCGVFVRWTSEKSQACSSLLRGFGAQMKGMCLKRKWVRLLFEDLFGKTVWHVVETLLHLAFKLNSQSNA